MKILYVCLFPIEANSSGMMRNLAVVKGLLANKHEVDFLTIPTSRYNVIISNDDLNKINIIRTKSNRAYDSITSVGNKKTKKIKEVFINILRKVYHKLSIFDYTLKIAKDISLDDLSCSEYDIIISSSDPKTSHIAVNNLLKQGLSYKKWIQYWGDPLTLDITNKSVYPRWILKSIEKNILKKADDIIYVSPFTCKEQATLFQKLSSKMRFCPIPYKEIKTYPPTNNSKFIVGYYGAYKSSYRDIMPLFDSCVMLNKQVNLIVMGDSDHELPSADNVESYPRGNVSEYEAKTDLLICVLNKRGTQIPGKIYHYAATNKPILVLLDGEHKEEMRKYLESFNRYIICNNTVEEITESIMNMIENFKEYTPSIEFSPDKISEDILDIKSNIESEVIK